MPASEQTPEALATAREIRDRLAVMDRADVQLQYLKALSTGDTVFTRAVENAPQAFALLDNDTRQDGEEWRLKHSPMAERLAAEEAELYAYRQVTISTKTELDKLGGRYQ